MNQARAKDHNQNDQANHQIDVQITQPLNSLFNPQESAGGKNNNHGDGHDKVQAKAGFQVKQFPKYRAQNGRCQSDGGSGAQNQGDDENNIHHFAENTVSKLVPQQAAAELGNFHVILAADMNKIGNGRSGNHIDSGQLKSPEKNRIGGACQNGRISIGLNAKWRVLRDVCPLNGASAHDGRTITHDHQRCDISEVADGGSLLRIAKNNLPILGKGHPETNADQKYRDHNVEGTGGSTNVLKKLLTKVLVCSSKRIAGSAMSATMTREWIAQFQSISAKSFFLIVISFSDINVPPNINKLR